MTQNEPCFYTIQVTLLEDLHTGSGMGLGELDDTLPLDTDALPYIPASHFKGVLRDNAYRLLDLSGGSITIKAEEKENNFGQADIKQLFGAEKHQSTSLLTIGSLRCLADSSPKTLTWSSTARTPFKRTPLDHSLRRIEFLPAGTVLNAKVLLADTSLLALFKACLAFTNRLGGSRNRGAGLIKCAIVKTENSPTTRVSGDAGNLSLRLILKTAEPVCIPKTGFPGNTLQSECFIRGQTLLGALVGWCDQYRRDFIPTLLSRAMTIGNVYPLPSGLSLSDEQWLNCRVMPIPLHFYREKTTPEYIENLPWWLSQDGAQTVDKLTANNSQVKAKRPFDNTFIFSSDENFVSYTPNMRTSMHNQVAEFRPDKLEERKLTKKGELFSIESIAENTLLMVDLHFPDKSNADAFTETFTTVLAGQSWLKLGRGGAPAEVVNAAWHKKGESELGLADLNTLRITLSSDLIARDSSLGFFQQLNLDTLTTLLNLTDLNTSAIEQTLNFQDTEIIKGFNAASGLNRAPALSIRRGSVLALKGDAETLEKIAEALNKKQALGERTWEGFGRFEINFAPDFDLVDHSPCSLAGNHHASIIATAKTLSEKLTHSLSDTQLNRLKHLLTVEKGLSDIKEHLVKSDKKNSAKWNGFWDELEPQLKDIDKAKHLAIYRLLVRFLIVQNKGDNND